MLRILWDSEWTSEQYKTIVLDNLKREREREGGTFYSIKSKFKIYPD